MLWDLRRMDLRDWHPRQILRTEALLEQQARGLGADDEWWLGLLVEGALPAAHPTEPDKAISGDWTEAKEVSGLYREIHHKGLLHHARISSPRLKHRSDAHIGRYLVEMGCKSVRVRCARAQHRKRGLLPPLDQARAAWQQRFPGWTWDRMATAWGDSDEKEK